MAEKVLFATLPLLSTCILTWFLCIEIPVLDLSLCFSTIYFIHIYFLGKPRSHQLYSISHSSIHILNSKIMIQLYALPIVISIILHIVIHHNVLSSTFTMLNNLMISILVPTILMIICFEHHIEYWPSRIESMTIYYCHISKSIAILLFLICLQNHSFFYDLKIYSGVKEPYVSMIFILAIICTTFTIYVHENYTLPYLNEMKEDITQSSHSTLGRKLLYADIAENSGILLATLSVGSLLRLPSILFVFGVLCIRINFFFTRSSLKNRHIAKSIFIIAAAITAFAVSLSFTSNTLGIGFWFLKCIMHLKYRLGLIKFQFQGFWGLSMEQFNWLSSFLVAFSICIPALLDNRSQLKGTLSEGPLDKGTTVITPPSTSLAFEIAFGVFNITAASLELIVREQVSELLKQF